MSTEETPKVTGIYAWLSSAKLNDDPADPGGEAIIAGGVPGLGFTPLILAETTPGWHINTQMAAIWDNFAREAVEKSGEPVEVVKFGPNGREHVRWIEP